MAGLVVAAPHLFVEPLTIASIEEARRAYDEGDLRARLARYHDDVDRTFRLDQAAEAMRALLERQVTGRVAITL